MLFVEWSVQLSPQLRAESDVLLNYLGPDVDGITQGFVSFIQPFSMFNIKIFIPPSPTYLQGNLSSVLPFNLTTLDEIIVHTCIESTLSKHIP